jgi:hypothetical protein
MLRASVWKGGVFVFYCLVEENFILSLTKGRVHIET